MPGSGTRRAQAADIPAAALRPLAMGRRSAQAHAGGEVTRAGPLGVLGSRERLERAAWGRCREHAAQHPGPVARRHEGGCVRAPTRTPRRARSRAVRTIRLPGVDADGLEQFVV